MILLNNIDSIEVNFLNGPFLVFISVEFQKQRGSYLGFNSDPVYAYFCIRTELE